MTEQKLIIATRSSPLALWQAHYVRDRLTSYWPNLRVELLEMTTRGDKILDTPLAKIGGKGLFVKELEVAMLEQRADIAVHSMKDVPMEFPEGLELGVICEREDPRDAFVSNQYKSLNELPEGAVVGTSSLRRQCQVKACRPDLVIKDLRGNVGTRLRKLDEGEYDAIILASAGLIRLGLSTRIAQFIDVEQSLPAGGQGAVGIELRIGDTRVAQLLEPLHCATTARRVVAERALNRYLNGGCQVPIACYATVNDQNDITLTGRVGDIETGEMLEASFVGDQPTQVGETVAKQLLDLGAAPMLKKAGL